MFKKWLIGCLLAFLLMSHNVSALELTQNVSSKYPATGYTFTNSTFDSCSYYFDGTLIANGNQDITCNISLLYINGANRSYNVGDYIVVTVYGTSNREGSDFESQMRANVGARVTGTGAVDLVDIRSQQYSANSYSWNYIFRVTTAGTVRNLELYNSNFSGFYLFPQENLIAGFITSFEPQSINATISGTVNVNLDSVLSALNTISSNQLSGITKLEQIRFGVEQIYLTLTSNSQKLEEIADNTENVSDYVDEQRQAYQNMQNTDGLIDIGDQSQALSIIGALNGVLGTVKSIPASATCIISGNIGRIDMGNLNLCQGKENFGSIVAFVATTIFLFISFFIVIRVIKKILRIISWARSN